MAKTDNKEKHYFQGFEAGSDSFVQVTVLIYAPSIYIYHIYLSQHDKKDMFFALAHAVGYIVLNAVVADWESLLYYMGMRELGNLIIFLPFFILSPMIVVALGFIIMLCLSAFRKQR